MTNNEKKQYLKQYKTLDNRINCLLDERHRWWELATRISPSYKDTPPVNGTTDKIQYAVEKIIDLDSEINSEIDRLVDLRRNIKSAISSIKDDTLQDLLELRYIHGLTWEAVADKMHYDVRQIYRLHGYALSKLKICQ